MTVAAVHGVIVIAAALVGSLAPASAAEPADWPCEQVLVPAVSAAVVWAGPPVDETGSAWRDSAPVSELVDRITPRRVGIAQAEAAIDRFAQHLPPAERSDALTMVFAGVLERANSERSELMAGIRRFARQQQELARQLDNGLSEVARLRADPATAAQADELESKIAWGKRLFDDRERSIRFLCEQPVLVEERLGELARAIAARLP